MLMLQGLIILMLRNILELMKDPPKPEFIATELIWETGIREGQDSASMFGNWKTINHIPHQSPLIQWQESADFFTRSLFYNVWPRKLHTEHQRRILGELPPPSTIFIIKTKGLAAHFPFLTSWSVLWFIYANHSYWWFLHKDETGLYNLWINFSDLFINPNQEY